MIWTAPALADLDNIREFVSTDDPGAAWRMVLRIGQAASRLDTFPAMGRPGKVEGTRELVIARTPYYVVYRVRGDVVEALRVIHGARDWPRRR